MAVTKRTAAQPKTNETDKDADKQTMKTCNDATLIPNLKREGPVLPSVSDLLKYGTGKEEKPKTFWESLKEPLLLALLFAVTLFIFHNLVLTRPRTVKPYVLPQYKPGVQDRMKRN